MEINGIRVDVDIEQYLAGHQLSGIRARGEWVQACCPFHDDRHPSFAVNVEHGGYSCLACGAKGSFPALVQKLDGFDTTYDAAQWLIANHGHYVVREEPLVVRFADDEPTTDWVIPDTLLAQYRYRHPYLTERSIPEKWQRLFEVGYSKRDSAITLPWRDERGRLLTIKFRSVRDKSFWYAPSVPSGVKAQTLYGLDRVLKWNQRIVAITEAEIDCISVWSAEIIGAVALGGNHMSSEQAAKLVRTLPEDTEIVIFTDADSGGDAAANSIVDALVGRFTVSRVDWALVRHPAKDANDLTPDEIRDLVDKRNPVGLSVAID